jgi:hypothetical protein
VEAKPSSDQLAQWLDGIFDAPDLASLIGPEDETE